jgi:aromatic ring-opening dioxygenase catalytic subunit (LigB family)
MRMPVAFVPHGGGPVTHVEMGFPKAEVDALARYWRSIRELPPAPPKALLAVSAHWEAPVPTVMTAPQPPMLYDYGGMPDEAYRLKWPVPGDRALATRVRELLARAGIATAEDVERGFDHGTFTPLKQAYPDAEVPVVQLSLKAGLGAAEHLAIGGALAPLRDEGIFIVGSGDTFHNMREFRRLSAPDKMLKFEAWLTKVVTGDATARDAMLERWEEAPHARYSHPREEHLLPLMVIAGAAGADAGIVTWSGDFMGSRQTGYHFR